MKIEQGKFYRTRDGRKVGLLYPTCFCDFPWEDRKGNWWSMSGHHNLDVPDSNNPDLDIVEEWVETPKTWSEMSDAEKGALLLAEHEGKDIECFQKTLNDWVALLYPIFNPEIAYRVKPEPKRETVQLYGRFYANSQWVFGSSDKADTHRITFDLFDGEPECESIRMELIE